MYISDIKNAVGENTPFFLSDLIKSDVFSCSSNNLRQALKRMADKKEVIRIENGIYYFPHIDKNLGMIPINKYEVIKSKYINRNNKNFGFFSGLYLLYRFNLTTQSPATIEIISNGLSTNIKYINIGNITYVIKKSQIKITNENYKTLILLELLKMIDKYDVKITDEGLDTIRNYINKNNISENLINEYIPYFTNRVYKSYYKLDIKNAFTQR